MITLAIDASTYTGDVAVLDDGRLLAEASIAMKGVEHERLMPAVVDVLDRAGVSVSRLNRVVCGAGPGSFTSLRIAGGIAKGLAMGVGLPLYAAPSLGLIIGGAGLPPGRYLAAIDALRSEFYVGLYIVGDDGVVSEIEPARLVAADEVDAVAAEFSAKLVSPSPFAGVVKVWPRARAVSALEGLLQSRGPIDISSWEPAYGRLAEAQVKWEAANRKPLPIG